ncbi:MAG: DMT family transporter [bacterium]|nr:DMT family transporter [bacterium]
MFIIYALLAAVCYAMQNNMMTFYYRRTPALDASTHRGLILGLSGLPLIFLTPVEQRLPSSEVFLYMLIACICGAIGNMYYIKAIALGSVGIAAATVRSISTIGTISIGLIFLDEHLAREELLLVAAVIFFVIRIGRAQNYRQNFEHPPGARFAVSLASNYASRTGVLYAVMFVFLAIASRSAHPFVIAYMLELGVGLCGLFFLLLRHLITGREFIRRISPKDIFRVMIYSSPTLLGTPLSNFSLKLGNAGIATAVLSSNIAFNCLLAWFIHKEKLTTMQVIYIICLMLSIAMLHTI